MNTGIIVGAVLIALGVGFIVGQNTKCVSIFGATTCVVNNPLK